MRTDFEPCPRAGGGVHLWLLSTANRCRNAGRSPDEAADLLRAGSRDCGRFVPPGEIGDAIRKAYASDWGTTDGGWKAVRSLGPAPWPSFDPAAVARIVSSGITRDELHGRSPVWFDANARPADEVIDRLFLGDPLLCVARRHPRDARTALRSAWRGQLDGCALMVPSAMSASFGRTLDGRTSNRCLSNVGPRRFLVIESDRGDLDSQAAVLWHLAKHVRLVLVVHSGGKSLHGWFCCVGIPELRLREFMRRCVRLGADPATWSRCQMVRIPGGTRDNGRRQAVIYFNPMRPTQ